MTQTISDTISSFSGMKVSLEEVGTVITDDRNAKSEVITETNYIMVDNTIYCSKNALAELERYIDERNKKDIIVKPSS